jgi:hypothetical protein
MPVISKDIRKLNLFEISIVTLFWVLLFASPLLLGQSDGGIDWKHVIKVWKEHSILLTLFLLNRFILLPYIFLRDKRSLYLISVFILIAIAVTGMYLYDRKPNSGNVKGTVEFTASGERWRDNPDSSPPPRRRDKANRPDSSRPEPIPAHINLLILSVLVFGFDTGLKIASKWVHSEQQRINLEKENVETRLAFLKHQISPHFFMNTLNNIHSLIDVDTVEAKKAVIKLSNLMRHLLYESDTVISPLTNEIDFIRSYVDLMKLRYDKEVRIILSIPDQIPDKSIPPLLFVSLLDNAFKHGISYISESFVEIGLQFTNEKLCFNIKNSKVREKSKTEPGIGLENTRKRLDLLYGKNYILEIMDKGTIFITNLTIPI